MAGSAVSGNRQGRDRRLLWYVVLGVVVLAFMSFPRPTAIDATAANGNPEGPGSFDEP